MLPEEDEALVEELGVYRDEMLELEGVYLLDTEYLEEEADEYPELVEPEDAYEGSMVTGPRGWLSLVSLNVLIVFLKRSFSRLGVLRSLTDALRPNKSFQMGVDRSDLVDMMPFGVSPNSEMLISPPGAVVVLLPALRRLLLEPLKAEEKRAWAGDAARADRPPPSRPLLRACTGEGPGE